MAYKFFKLERSQHVTTVIIDKPPMNTLDKDLYPELHTLCDELDGDGDTRAIVFASRNPKVFIAGADIKEMTTYRFEEEWIENRISTVHKALNRVEDLKKPTVAVIEGHALGGGCEFSLCCDFRFMSRGKWLIGLPEISLGIIPGGGGTLRLPRVVGYGKASEIILTGGKMGADEAERIGLIHRACEEGKTFVAAQEFAQLLAAQAPVAASLAKQCLRKTWGANREEGLKEEKEDCLRAVLSADAREGISAFVEKRKANWKGQ
ncbi:MAG: enoyl-CoA hydratase/isomerase family protein [Terriglobales bacterium]|jgi:enoyl-CoA hydratase/carnithine racemase